MTDPELSIVIPCYNEQENVAAICAAVSKEADAHVASHDIILIDNGSTDDTRAIIRQICADQPHVRAIFNSRNFGQMRSPTHGIYQARGQAVIGMCADFQDPPEMIGPFVAQWRAGAQIVLAQRKEDKESVFRRMARGIGYGLFQKYADTPSIPGVTGFGLYARAVVDTLSRWNEPEPYFRGMLVESGYRLALLPCARPQRAGGRSKNSIRTIIDFAISGFSGSAKSLLRAPLFLALYAGLAAVLLAIASLWSALAGGPTLLPAVFAGLLGMMAILLFFIGLIGEQVRIISERTRNMPLVIEAERINFPDAGIA